MALSPRAIIDARLSGALVATSLQLSNVEGLRRLQALLVCPDAALELGFRGGHLALQRLLTSKACLSDEELLEEVGNTIAVIAAALPPSLSFPLCPGLDHLHPPAPVALDLRPLLPIPPRVEVDSNANAEPEPRLTVLARMVPSSIHSLKGQEDVGQLLWPAAPVLARFLAKHYLPARIDEAKRRGKRSFRILEIGAGMGLTGLAAGLTASYLLLSQSPSSSSMDSTTMAVEATLTDYDNPVVLHNLAYNARINEPQFNQNHASLSALPCPCPCAPPVSDESQGQGQGQPPPPLFAVRKLDWSVYPPPGLLKEKAGEYAERRRRAKAGAVDDGSGEDAPVSSPSSSISKVETSSSGFAFAKAAEDEEEEKEASDAPSSSSSFSSFSSNIPILPKDSSSSSFDLILGSDMICCVEDAFCVAHCLASHLPRPSSSSVAPAPPAEAFLLLPPPEIRWGIEAVAEALTSVGLVFTTEPIATDCLEAATAAAAGSAAGISGSQLVRYRPLAGTTEGCEKEASKGEGEGDEEEEEEEEEEEDEELVMAGGYESKLVLYRVTWPDDA